MALWNQPESAYWWDAPARCAGRAWPGRAQRVVATAAPQSPVSFMSALALAVRGLAGVFSRWRPRGVFQGPCTCLFCAGGSLAFAACSLHLPGPPVPGTTWYSEYTQRTYYSWAAALLAEFPGAQSSSYPCERRMSPGHGCYCTGCETLLSEAAAFANEYFRMGDNYITLRKQVFKGLLRRCAESRGWRALKSLMSRSVEHAPSPT